MVLTYAAITTVVLLFATFLKIWKEHEQYEKLAVEVVWLWRRWGFIRAEATDISRPLPVEAKDLGTGDGWLASVFIILVLPLMFAAFAYSFCH